ncbi:hypothetical protein T01_10868 [Trichinella spiralis]|uniref:Uncharacterized protein n=1 Tax=Trichinella spiralis TaxID=6334 RepID=A0A0V1BZV9_TRISP|nr:hypothetical protein T01_10868 [Trichinella spiralis]
MSHLTCFRRTPDVFWQRKHRFFTVRLLDDGQLIESVKCSSMPGKSNYFCILLQWADIKRPLLPSPSYSTYSFCTPIAC